MAVNVTQSTRDLSQLKPLVGAVAQMAFIEAKNKGIDVLLTETYRPLERQYYLYCHGRTVQEAIAGGVPKVKAEKYVAQLKAEGHKGGKITWTINSIHIQKQALDAIPQRVINKKMTAVWNSADPQTKQLVSIMSKYGFESGANWLKNVDSPHFQIKGKLGATINKNSTTVYLTKAIQNALAIALGKPVVANGTWSKSTDDAVVEFRKKMNYKTVSPTLGVEALKALLSYLG